MEWKTDHSGKLGRGVCYKKVDSIEGTYGYGYQLWMEERPGSFEYNGMLGQNVLIYPDVDMVIVTNAGNEELFQDNVMLNIIRKYFPVDWMPKETLPENPIAYAKLQELTEICLKKQQCYNHPLTVCKGGWKKNSEKYRARGEVYRKHKKHGNDRSIYWRIC